MSHLERAAAIVPHNDEHQRRHRLGAARWMHKLGGMRSLQFPESDVLYRMIWSLLKNEVRPFSRG